MRTARSRARARRRMGADSMAGWLFADLLLVLFVVGLGSQITLTPQPEPEPAPVVAEPAGPPVMRQEAQVVEVSVNPAALLAGDQAEIDRLAAEITAKTAGMQDSQAVLVLVFGYSPVPDRGVAISEAVAGVITTLPAPFSPQTQTRAFWDGEPTEGTVRLEIFLLDNPPEATA